MLAAPVARKGAVVLGDQCLGGCQMESREATGTRHVYAIFDARVGAMTMFGSFTDSNEK